MPCTGIRIPGYIMGAGKGAKSSVFLFHLFRILPKKRFTAYVRVTMEDDDTLFGRSQPVHSRAGRENCSTYSSPWRAGSQENVDFFRKENRDAILLKKIRRYVKCAILPHMPDKQTHQFLSEDNTQDNALALPVYK